ncbi:MAG TPA: molybdenum cofactor biosynthesis protein MoaE, partial [bacterium]|nr:molybdenum cofactor biosynthesis protein MoaE [bacterium]
MPEDNEKIFARITTSPLSADSAYQFCLSPENGAVDIFIGTVRNEFGGRPVEQIDYQAYPDMAEKILRTILQS